MKSDTNRELNPGAWGLRVNSAGELTAGGCNLVQLAGIYGTPLHVVNERQLRATALGFVMAFRNRYPGKVSVHYAFKCNSVPAVVGIIRESGLKAEVMSEYELRLALDLNYKGENIIVNGPYKPENLLKRCLDSRVRLIIVDSLSELEKLILLCHLYNKKIKILLRINPDYVPRGMNQGSATGSRSGCSFGLDLIGDEVFQALEKLGNSELVEFQGFHFHIGTGIYDPADYRKALERLKHLVDFTHSLGFAVRIMDVGGGFATPASREMTSLEMLAYQVWNRLPAFNRTVNEYTFSDYANEVTAGLLHLFKPADLPELILEPGRSIASSAQMLLLTVHQVKERAGLRKWVITDGGIGTVTMPTYYEYHEVFLCNDLMRPRSQHVNINGPVCFAGDVVYRNKKMPVVKDGEVLAIMDSGAYFTSWESSFGFPRPAIIAVSEGHHHLLRRRETYEDMVARDEIYAIKELHNPNGCLYDHRRL